jgi:hypothetical protein
MSSRRFTDKEEKAICARYINGESQRKIALALGVTHFCIRSVLKRNKVSLRTLSAAAGGLCNESCAQICARYIAGESSPLLASAFCVSEAYVISILKRNGIERRSKSEARGGLSYEAKREVCKRYQAGENLRQLGAAFNVSRRYICNILIDSKIERRDPGGYRDSVQHALDCTGFHACISESEFYVYELANYSDSYCKPGISFDANVRVALGCGCYGPEELRLFFSSRTEAYFLEQAVLDATRGVAGCPVELRDWKGASEVRAMPASDLVPIVLQLADELDNLGMWEFAARYVPMTSAQRVICQQRALAPAPLLDS